MYGGGHPEWHIKGDVIPIINGNCSFTTVSGEKHFINSTWDMIIAFPPCTYLSSVGTRHYSLKHNSAEKVIDRIDKREAAAIFFMRFALANCNKIAIENPQGHMSKVFRKPDQTISPYMFASSTDDTENYHQKRTCLWLKGLECLKTNQLPPPKPIKRYINKNGKYKNVTWEMIVTGKNQKERAKNRSKTFPGIAKAMAEQWG